VAVVRVVGGGGGHRRLRGGGGLFAGFPCAGGNDTDGPAQKIVGLQRWTWGGRSALPT
jgi:hypothetical protein